MTESSLDRTLTSTQHTSSSLATSWAKGITRFARRNKIGAAAGFVVIFFVILAVIGPEVAPYSPAANDFERLAAPSLSHPFGTDSLFRDMFSRIIVGARNSLGIGFASVAISLCLGTLLGVSSGYLGGWWDIVVSRAIEVQLTLPGLVFTIFFLSVFETSYISVTLAIGINLTPAVVRIVRGSTIGVRNMQFIEAAISVGNSPFRTMWRHILPNVVPSIIVIASLQIGIAILIESSISFLGLGVSNPSNPSWGRMLQETRSVWQLAWWTAIFPGMCISIAVLSFNLFGDALRDALDPRLRDGR